MFYQQTIRVARSVLPQYMARSRKSRNRLLHFLGKALRLLGILILASVLISVASVAALRWMNPITSSFMLQDRLEHRRPVLYTWVDRQQISEYLAIAAVAAEDQRFPTHHGIDWTEMENAFVDYLHGDRLRGASTITQQVAKNLYLWKGRSMFRKLLEMGFAILIELMWNKDRILEVYLNIIELGDGVYGVQEASWKYFNRPARQIDLRQASLLMSVLPDPTAYNVRNPSRYHQQRAHVIARDVMHLGGIGYLRRTVKKQ